MSRMPIAPVLFAVAGLAAGEAGAEGKSARACPQALGGYGALDQQVLLEFNGDTDLGFRLIVGQGSRSLQGFVYPGEADEDMQAVVLDNCPDGDVTGAELDACTIWRGAIQATNTEGEIKPMPGADQPAAGFLQLQGLSAALVASEDYSDAGLPAGGFETFTLLACQE